MPFKSKSQMRFMFATMPETAKRWAEDTKDNPKRLPEKVSPWLSMKKEEPKKESK